MIKVHINDVEEDDDLLPAEKQQIEDYIQL